MVKKIYKYVTLSILSYLYNDHKVEPSHIILLKTSASVKNYDGQTKWIYFSIKDDDLLKKYNTVRDKESADIKKDFDNEPIYTKEFLKNKIKRHGDEATDFLDKKLPRVDSNHNF